MESDIIAITVAFILGVAARSIGLPPMVGYLLAGFVLYAGGGQITPVLKEFSELGVTLLLFSIGLKLRVRNLLMPQIWAVASLHILIITSIVTLFILLLAFVGISYFTKLDLQLVILLAFALSFSSTVFAVKVLEDNGEMYSLYGKITIGVLIIQDIAAVLYIAISSEKIPSVWALSLLLLLFLRPILYKLFEKAGHGELQVLFGLTLALGGAQLFEFVNVKGDLGALILGVLLANHTRASELARQLLSFKDLFLVGFFLSIGLSGPLSWDSIIISLLLLLLLPFKTVFFFVLFSHFKLRVRTSLLASIGLSSFSEFGLIVITVAVANQLLPREWLLIIAVTVSLSFVISASLNTMSYRIYSYSRNWLARFESSERIAIEQDIYPGETNVIIFGMGRIGLGAYEVLSKRKELDVLGVDIDEETVNALIDNKHHVIRGSATDPEFWSRIKLDFNNVKLILLAMPNTKENIFATQQLNKQGFSGKIAAVAKYPDEIKLLQQTGVHAVFNLYAEAGAGFAEHICETILYEIK